MVLVCCIHLVTALMAARSASGLRFSMKSFGKVEDVLKHQVSDPEP